MTYDEFLNFLDKYEEIRSFAKKIEYAKTYLGKPLGSGSGRIVFNIDGTKVFKIAKNTKGVAQNEEEINASSRSYNENIITKVFDHDRNDGWIVAELAKKVGEKRIKELTGIPNLLTLYYFLRNWEEQMKGKNKIFGISNELTVEMEENEWVRELMDFIDSNNQTAGDMGRPSSYGEVIRNGQPQIVLSDYGLSLDVYDTHYSPNRQKNRMYELYNFADGNDDMLSDIGNVGMEVQRGMWALMPYGVSDGDGVVNMEENVKFIEGRNTYPDKPINNMGHLTDMFHECVNNIKETMKIVKNKRLFYNNLLKLQEYLIKQNAYDREPLPELIDESLGNDYTDKVADLIANKFGYGSPEYLMGGTYGQAYTVGDKVLKVTSDYSEAVNNVKLIGKELQYIATPYAVYDIQPKSGSESQRSWVIVLEKLKTDLNYFVKMKDRLDHISNLLFGGRFYYMLRVYIDDRKIFDRDYSDTFEKYFITNPEDGKYYHNILKIQDELEANDISTNDYMNPKNLGYKPNGNIGFFDIGFSLVDTHMPKPPETVEIDEDSSALYSTDSDIGNTGFPAYAQGYYGDDTDQEDVDKHYVNERQLHWIPGSVRVEVKKKCRLGGNGGTSTACNTGDINNLKLTPLNERENIEQQQHNQFELIKPPAYPNANVLDVVKKYYPKARMQQTTTKADNELKNRYFVDKSGGSYSEGGIKRHLVDVLIDDIKKYAERLGGKDFRYTKNTQSVYFTIYNLNFRISDHYNPFEGINIVLQWNSDIDFIKTSIEKIITSDVGTHSKSSHIEDERNKYWNAPSENVYMRGKTNGYVIDDWIKRHGRYIKEKDGLYLFYHGTPKVGGASTYLKAGSLLAFTPDEAIHYAARDRGLKPQDINVIALMVDKRDLIPGIFPSIRVDIPIHNNVATSKMLSEGGVHAPIDDVNVGDKYWYNDDNLPENLKDRLDVGNKPTSEYATIINDNKKFLGLDPHGVKVYEVSGEAVRKYFYPDFTEGGNDMAYPNFIPKNEIWLDNDVIGGERVTTLVHESLERYEMFTDGKFYDVGEGENENGAHVDALNAEKKIRTGEMKPIELKRNNKVVDYNKQSLSEGAYGGLNSFVTKKHLGWLLPNNEFVETGAHLDYLQKIYPIDSNAYDEDEDAYIDLLYGKALGDGLIRINYQFINGAPSLTIQGWNKNRIVDIIENVYYPYLSTVRSTIFLDIKGNWNEFELPRDKEKISKFIFGGDNDTTINENINPNNLKSIATNVLTGWLLPDNTFIESRNHITYLKQRYSDIIEKNSENPENDEVPDEELYYNAYNDGLIRIWMEKHLGGPELGIRGRNKNRIKDLIEKIYYPYFVNKSGHIYVDVVDGEQYSFGLPDQKGEFAEFIFGNNDNNLGIRENSSTFAKSNESSNQLNESSNMDAFLNALKQRPFMKAIQKMGGNLYVVNNLGW